MAAPACLIVFSGLPGTGKSLLAQELGRRLHTPVLSVDPIESAILRAGLAPGFETGLAAYLVAEAIADSQLALGQGAIVDAVNAVEPAKEMWRRLATRHGVVLKVIECCCSDEALHRERLETRRRGLAENFPEPTWEAVLRRSGELTPWSEPRLAVDAVAPCDANVRRALAWLEGAPV
jgi:predicted kinase